MQGNLIFDNTLGGKAKSFRWKIDNECNLHIHRKFQTKTGTMEHSRIVSSVDLTAVINYVSADKWHDLANNIANINNGTEKEGVGRFLHETLGWPPSDCQLASHLGAMFFRSGVWDYNGKKRGIKFRGTGIDWCEAVTKYYLRGQHDSA